MSSAPRPYTLVAELTYACPLHCVYCSNPVDFTRHEDALDAADWRRVLREAERLGVVQVNFTGGEPLLRPDLEALVEEARSLDLYSNLITSGIPLARERLERLRRLGLDNVQVSIQDARPDESDRIAGREAFHRKIEVARWVKELGFPLTVNTVLRGVARRPPRAGQRPIPRVGPQEPDRAPPHQGTARAGAVRRRGSSRAA